MESEMHVTAPLPMSPATYVDWVIDSGAPSAICISNEGDADNTMSLSLCAESVEKSAEPKIYKLFFCFQDEGRGYHDVYHCSVTYLQEAKKFKEWKSDSKYDPVFLIFIKRVFKRFFAAKVVGGEDLEHTSGRLSMLRFASKSLRTWMNRNKNHQGLPYEPNVYENSLDSFSTYVRSNIASTVVFDHITFIPPFLTEGIYSGGKITSHCVDGSNFEF